MGDETPLLPSVEGDDFLDGLSDMESLPDFSSEYNITPCARV